LVGYNYLVTSGLIFLFHRVIFQPAHAHLIRSGANNVEIPSIRAFGKVDVDGFVSFREHTAGPDVVDLPLRHHPAVKAVQGQFWGYHEGNEWLVANPIFVPALRRIVRAALDAGPDFDVECSPFAPWMTPDVGKDDFSRLPREIINEILGYLAPRDIATLRLASRAFTHLPISLWRKFPTNEMPWMYEAWSRDPEPYMWLTRDAEHLAADRIARERAAKDHEWDRRMRREVMQKDMPEIYDAWAADEKPFVWPPTSTSHEEEEMTELSPVALTY
jgi:hypothetical protein